MAQWKRAGPITQRSVDRNHALLVSLFQVEVIHGSWHKGCLPSRQRLFFSKWIKLVSQCRWFAACEKYMQSESRLYRENDLAPPRRGIEPRSPAWQAGILTTILSRNTWSLVSLCMTWSFWVSIIMQPLVTTSLTHFLWHLLIELSYCIIQCRFQMKSANAMKTIDRLMSYLNSIP